MKLDFDLRNKLYDLYYFFKFRIPTLEGYTYTVKYPWVLFKKRGKIELTDGQSFYFNEKNKRDILELVLFALLNGIHFGHKRHQWKFNEKEGYVETHQGIKLKLKGIGILDETFLKQIHFAGFDLKNKIVITAGAYIGDTPLFYAYYGAKVYAFEPNPISFSIAKENLNLNPKLKKNIVLLPYAVGMDGNVSFPLEEDSGGSSIYLLKEKTIKVKSVSISTILERFQIKHPFLLDLDIKGAEFTVVKDQSIGKFKRIRIEYSPYLLEKIPEHSLEFLIRKIREYGFKNIRVYKHNDLRFDLLNHGTIEAEK